jgi:hypothetical protein
LKYEASIAAAGIAGFTASATGLTAAVDVDVLFYDNFDKFVVAQCNVTAATTVVCPADIQLTAFAAGPVCAKVDDSAPITPLYPAATPCTTSNFNLFTCAWSVTPSG